MRVYTILAGFACGFVLAYVVAVVGLVMLYRWVLR